MTEREISRMGLGFFVVKLYSDSIDKNEDWKKDISKDTRLNVYYKIKQNDNDCITLLKRVINSKAAIRFEAITKYDQTKIKEMANELLRLHEKDLKESVVKKDFFGPDSNGYFVKYESNVEDKDKIKGLVSFLESEYENVLGFAHLKLKFTDLRRIPVYLSKEKPCDKYKLSKTEIARIIKKRVDQIGRNLTYKEILNLLDENMIVKRLGKYFYNNNEPYIKIYYLNCLKELDMNLYKARLSIVLAHEYMHHIHYFNGYRNIDHMEACDKGAKAVKEGLADFFAFLYLINTKDRNPNKLRIAHDRYLMWDAYLDTSFPYANAFYFYFIKKVLLEYSENYDEYISRKQIDKFKSVFEISLDNWENAFKELKEN